MAPRLLLGSPMHIEATLARTSRSLAAQTRRPDLWLIVDDGSSDGTVEAVEREAAGLSFARTPPMLREFHDDPTLGVADGAFAERARHTRCASGAGRPLPWVLLRSANRELRRRLRPRREGGTWTRR